MSKRIDLQVSALLNYVNKPELSPDQLRQALRLALLGLAEAATVDDAGRTSGEVVRAIEHALHTDAPESQAILDRIHAA